MKNVAQPIKVIDNFLEIPSLWRHYALKQDYSDENSTWPGLRSKTLDDLNIDLFHNLASKIIMHVPNKTSFRHLKINFSLVDKTWGTGWIHQDEPFYNVAGLIYLNPNPPKNSGTLFYSSIRPTGIDYSQKLFEEIKASPQDRKDFEKYKLEQRNFFRKNMTVEGKFNRCIIFNPSAWHSGDVYYGNDLETSRLTIVFFGTAI